MNIFQNLCPHESILLILGIILFAVLIFLLIWKTVKEQKIAVLLPFFLLPMAMIAYPTIGSIQYNDGKFEFNTHLAHYMQGPISEDRMDDFEKVYDLMANSCRVQHDPEMQTSFAQAKLASGNYEEATALSNRVLMMRPDYIPALEIQQQSREQMQLVTDFKEKTDQLQSIISIIEEGNTDPNRTLRAISRVLSEIRMPQNIEPESAMIVAKALAYAGENENALTLMNQVMSDPGISEQNTRRGRQLMTDIRNDRYTLRRTNLQEAEPAETVINPNLTQEALSRQRLKTRDLSSHVQFNIQNIQ